ncbi:hypothetical protein RUM44_009684 [Polyplax serrata]|uniref:Uncharacterized protein n=1 Tax=Polyplax serrata TaxID=468196 RepID=A0ABR1ATE6_POLSC
MDMGMDMDDMEVHVSHLMVSGVGATPRARRLNPIHFILFTLDFFLLVLTIYAFLCVVSQYQEYKAGRGRAEDDAIRVRSVTNLLVFPKFDFGTRLFGFFCCRSPLGVNSATPITPLLAHSCFVPAKLINFRSVPVPDFTRSTADGHELPEHKKTWDVPRDDGDRADVYDGQQQRLRNVFAFSHDPKAQRVRVFFLSVDGCEHGLDDGDRRHHDDNDKTRSIRYFGRIQAVERSQPKSLVRKTRLQQTTDRSLVSVRKLATEDILNKCF